ncbi:MAG: aldehyde ferredoxin oxidoreductase C-terminal domain-containing protein, partial [Anaerolineaceae bacterium]|nr:aldehyde ferredoxin oxidoreductase C-terminal domain-containing protein [Anaerolineaceae bacterium]
GGTDIRGLFHLLDEAEVQGLDVMSMGVTLAWATEAMHKGLITTKETDGLTLEWGNYAQYVEAAKRIVNQPNDFYKAMAHGAEKAASIYGGLDFALTFGKNEMPGYHTGPGCHLGYLTGARHSHLDSAGYSVDQKAIAKNESLTAEGIASALLEEERWRQVLTSLVICLFARGIYTPDVVQKSLALVGFERSAADIAAFGAETLHRKFAFKLREGYDPATMRIPRRIMETPSPAGKFDEELLRKAIAYYAANV